MKTILVNFPTQTFLNHSVRLIDNLSKKFKIVIFLSDYYIQPNHNKIIKNLKRRKKIIGYYKIPKHNFLLSYTAINYLKNIKNELISYNFDYFITSSNTSIYSKYICDKILNKNCKKILFPIGIPDFLRYQNIGTETSIKNLRRIHNFNEIIKKKLKNFYEVDIKKKIKKLFNSPRFFYSYLFNKIRNFLNFYMIPLLLTGKIYSVDNFEKKINISSEKIDLILVGNDFEKNLLKKFLKKNIIKTSLLDKNNCKCNKKKKKYPNGLLTCLSWPLFFEKIPHGFYESYLRDFKIIIKKMNIDTIHLRPHPEQLNNWEIKLKNDLKKLGISVKVIGLGKSKYGLDKSLSEIVCDYKVVAGFSSGALREAREYCDYVKVILFEKVSSYEVNHSENSKNFFNHINGIDYISFDGNYNNKIFKKKKNIYRGKYLSDYLK